MEGDGAMARGDPPDTDELRELVATGCRILANEGIVDSNGHLSVRLPGRDEFLMNARSSPALARPDNLVTVSFAGERTSGSGRPNSEWPIHAGIYRARPDVLSVAHTHSRMCVVFSMTPSRPLRPVFGAYVNQFGGGAVPVYRAPGLIRQLPHGDDMARALGGDAALLLRGHGNAVAGPTIKHTVLRAIWLERLADFQHLMIAQGGEAVDYFTPEEMEAWAANGTAGPDRGWEYFESRLPRE